MKMKIQAALLGMVLISGCSFLQRSDSIEVTAAVEENLTPIQAAPAAIKTIPIKWYVVTEENLAEFQEKYIRENGRFVFYAISPKDYESMSLNLQDIARYIKQQKEIIVFYEKAVTK